MLTAKVEAVLIKVAGIGLKVKHLGQTLLQMRDTLEQLVSIAFPTKFYNF